MPNARKYQIQSDRTKGRRHPKCMSAHGEEGFPHDLPHFAAYKDQEDNEWKCNCFARLWPGTVVCHACDRQLYSKQAVLLSQADDNSWFKPSKENPPNEELISFSPGCAKKALAGEL